MSGHVGTIDRVLRIILAAVLLGFAAFCPYAQELGMTAVIGSAVVGVVLLGTAVFSKCPLYKMLGMHT